jgi:glycolate oxidase
MKALEELAALLGESLVTDRDVVEGYRRDRAVWGPAGVAAALARPRSTAEVQSLARWATRHRVPLVARGAGSGVSGGASAIDSCVMVSFERMNQILELDEAAMLAVVQPGVLNVELKNAAQVRGLWYPPDPSSFEISSLGGNVATNAGGLCCVKYGVTGDYVLGLEAVLASGEVLRTGSRCRKDVAGYDLERLLVGSEGTLALITEITLRLRRRRSPATTLVAMFDTLEASGRAVAAMTRAADPSLLEIMDRATLRAVEAFARLELDTDAAAMLIAQSDTLGSAELSRMREACESAGATLVHTTDDEAEGQLLLNARRLAYPALERLGTVLIDDIAVPLPCLPEMFRRIERIAAQAETLVATVAHAGDGNIHPLVVFDPADADATRRAQDTFEALMTEALDLGGTITGEHGVGSLKSHFLRRQLGPVSYALHRRIKSAFDPDGILNPGKVIAL